jgi:HD superfamily phosphohydrolase YqeK
MYKALILFICIGFIFATTMVRENRPRNKIGGGDHDIIAFKFLNMKKYLNEKSLDQLKVEALKMEEYVNEKKGEMILGGLHDYIDTLDKEELVQVMSRMMTNNLELLDLEVYESVINPAPKVLAFLGEEEQKIGGLHDYIHTIDEATLRMWAIAADTYHLEKNGGQLIGGGIHDKLSTMKKLDFIEYLLKMIRQYPNLDSSVELNQLCVKYGISQHKDEKPEENEQPANVGGLLDYIWRQNDETLIQWALTADTYDKKMRNIHILGGLEDYIYSLSREELMQITLKHAKTYPELNSSLKLNQLAISYGFAEAEKKEDAHLKNGGLNDYISRQSEDVLRSWALTCEKYEIEKKNLIMIGGLHDYIMNLNEQELIDIVLQYARNYPELDSGNRLNELALSYGITAPKVAAHKEENHRIGGLEDYILRMTDETLRQWALSCEKYDRVTRKVELHGGLHDYINVLNKEQIVEIILNYVKSYPELNSGAKLTELSMEYGFTPEEETQNPSEPFIGGGLHDYIATVRNDVLFSWALTCDKYDREFRNVNNRGGLVDYIRLMKREEIIQIILEFVKKYPELNSATKLQELATKYGISAPEN